MDFSEVLGSCPEPNSNLAKMLEKLNEEQAAQDATVHGRRELSKYWTNQVDKRQLHLDQVGGSDLSDLLRHSLVWIPRGCVGGKQVRISFKRPQNKD